MLVLFRQMCTLRDTVHEYVTALEDVQNKIKHCPPEVSLHKPHDLNFAFF